MIVRRALIACLPGLLAVPLLAQPQIGGGTCSSASLNGAYSATLSGRDLNSTVAFANVYQAVGSATFDGLNKVTFNLTNNTSKFSGTAQTLAGTYTMQANCIGAITITSGGTESFTLEAYNKGGTSYLITGQDGVFQYTGNGSLLPATCPTSIPAGTYSFNGNGFALSSAQLVGVYDISGVVQISGTNTISLNSFVAVANGVSNISASGTFSVGVNCSATASVIDTGGKAYQLVLELTSGSGENFTFLSSGASGIFTGTGRLL
jgi:hypothetical protein